MWAEHWRRLASRIEGLTQASDFMLRTFQSERSDPGGVVRNSVYPELSQLKDELVTFQRTYAAQLPYDASRTLNEFLGKWNLPQDMKPGHELLVLQEIAPLGVFRAAFEFAADDAEAEAKALTELAFEHLKRSLVVDPATRESWQKAFSEGELRCEALGAIHLLSHGIWAFKIVGSGAATDLIFPEPVDQYSRIIERTSRALVLTEWKVVRSAEELKTRAAQARQQVKLYASGVLGGVELRSVRYIALVSEDYMAPPPDRTEGSVTYRHIVIAVQPRTPSKQARKTPHHQALAPSGSAAGEGR